MSFIIFSSYSIMEYIIQVYTSSNVVVTTFPLASVTGGAGVVGGPPKISFNFFNMGYFPCKYS